MFIVKLLLSDRDAASALELGRYNITVNSYAPGIIETPLSTSARCACADFRLLIVWTAAAFTEWVSGRRKVEALDEGPFKRFQDVSWLFYPMHLNPLPPL